MVVPDPSPMKSAEGQGRSGSTGTPRKPVKGAAFKKFLEHERSLLAVKYPFLTAAQIKNKSSERWGKLSDEERKQFNPRRVQVKSKSKNLRARIEEGRSPGRFFKSKGSRESPYISTPAKVKLASQKEDSGVEKQAQDFSFDFIDDTNRQVFGDEGETRDYRVKGKCDGKLVGTIYSGSDRYTRNSQTNYKPPEIVHDESNAALSQSILKTNEKKATPGRREVSFGDNDMREISDHYSTASSREVSQTKGSNKSSPESRRMLNYDYFNFSADEDNDDSDQEREIQMAGIEGNRVIPADSLDDSILESQIEPVVRGKSPVPKKSNKKTEQNQKRKKGKAARRSGGKQSNTIDKYFRDPCKVEEAHPKQFQAKSSLTAASSLVPPPIPPVVPSPPKDDEVVQQVSPLLRKKNKSKKRMIKTEKALSSRQPDRKKKSFNCRRYENEGPVLHTPGSKLQKAKILLGFRKPYISDFDLSDDDDELFQPFSPIPEPDYEGDDDDDDDDSDVLITRATQDLPQTQESVYRSQPATPSPKLSISSQVLLTSQGSVAVDEEEQKKNAFMKFIKLTPKATSNDRGNVSKEFEDVGVESARERSPEAPTLAGFKAIHGTDDIETKNTSKLNRRIKRKTPGRKAKSNKDESVPKPNIIEVTKRNSSNKETPSADKKSLVVNVADSESDSNDSSAKMTTSSSILDKIRQNMRKITSDHPLSIAQQELNEGHFENDDLMIDDDVGGEELMLVLDSDSNTESVPEKDVTPPSGSSILEKIKRRLGKISIKAYSLPSLDVAGDESNDGFPVTMGNDEVQFKTPSVPTLKGSLLSKKSGSKENVLTRRKKKPSSKQENDDDLTTPQTTKTIIEETMKKAAKAPKKRRKSQSELPSGDEEIPDRVKRVRKSLSDISLISNEDKPEAEQTQETKGRKVQLVKPSVRSADAKSNPQPSQSAGSTNQLSKATFYGSARKNPPKETNKAPVAVEEAPPTKSKKRPNRATRFLFPTEPEHSQKQKPDKQKPDPAVASTSSASPVAANNSKSVLSKVLERLRNITTPLLPKRNFFDLNDATSGFSTPYVASPALSGISEMSGVSNAASVAEPAPSNASSSKGETSQESDTSQIVRKQKKVIVVGNVDHTLCDMFDDPLPSTGQEPGRRCRFLTTTDRSLSQESEPMGADSMFL